MVAKPKALFYYQALERNGRKTKGMIEADLLSGAGP